MPPRDGSLLPGGRLGPGDLLRAGGAASLPGDARLVWSVAEGRRGRRWRWAVVVGDRVDHGVLLELDPDGRPTRLEATGACGLLTLHPEPDLRSVHGNLVTANGIEHLTFDWAPDAVFDVVDPFGPFATAAAVGVRLAVGGTVEVPTVGIDRFLRPVPGRARLTRLDRGSWSLAPAAVPGLRRSIWTGRLDEAGRPDLPAGRVWPLELDRPRVDP
jgi:hypothetical protein